MTSNANIEQNFRNFKTDSCISGHFFRFQKFQDEYEACNKHLYISIILQKKTNSKQIQVEEKDKL